MRFPTALLVILVALHGSPRALSAQRPPRVATAHIEGLVSLSSGAPARGAIVTVNCLGCLGRIHIDSTGRYSKDVPPGQVTLEVRCPSATSMGPIAESPALVLKAGERRVHDVVFPPNACREPAFATLRGDFRGIYVHHWEGSTFAFCDDVPAMAREVLARTDPPPTIAVSVPMANAANTLDHVGVMPNSQGQTPLYVEWRGTLAGPGQYGTWGLSEYMLTVDSVYAVRAMRLADCPRINPLAARTPARFDTAAVVLAAWRAAMARPASRARSRVLSVTSRVDLNTMPLSPWVSRQLREQGVPIVRPTDLYGSTRREAYHVANMQMQPDSAVQVTLTARYFVPRDGLEWFRSRTDSVRVRCVAGACTGRVVHALWDRP
ncbi:MAG: carboxypeptidase regulatory-like domain-containing protein [Gemmatimonadaceae bacterium]|nr:carboxypeptidase regulatory-like domain-containing protein [Gemmatimonadaceae bacterium]